SLRQMGERLVEIWSYRELIRRLTARDLKARYKGSALGFLWIFMNSVLMTVIFTVLFQVLLGQDSIEYFPLFVLIGLLVWNMHSASIMGGMFGVLAGAPLI